MLTLDTLWRVPVDADMHGLIQGIISSKYKEYFYIGKLIKLSQKLIDTKQQQKRLHNKTRFRYKKIDW